MANDSDYTPEYVNGKRVGPPACRWGDVNFDAYGFRRDDCNRASTLHQGTLLLCHKHVKELARMGGYMTMDEAEEKIRFRRKAKMDFMRQEIARLRLQVSSLQNPVTERKKRPTQGIIYFLRIGGYMKIGWTSNLENRMRDYQPDSQLLAVLPGTLKEEKAFHRRFANLKTHGREYFALAQQIDEEVARIVADYGPPPVVDFSARSRTRKAAPKLRVTNRGDQHHGGWGQATG